LALRLALHAPAALAARTPAQTRTRPPTARSDSRAHRCSQRGRRRRLVGVGRKDGAFHLAAWFQSPKTHAWCTSAPPPSTALSLTRARPRAARSSWLSSPRRCPFMVCVHVCMHVSTLVTTLHARTHTCVCVCVCARARDSARGSCCARALMPEGDVVGGRGAPDDARGRRARVDVAVEPEQK